MVELCYGGRDFCKEVDCFGGGGFCFVQYISDGAVVDVVVCICVVRTSHVGDGARVVFYGDVDTFIGDVVVDADNYIFIETGY